MKTEAIDSPKGAAVPEDGICSLCCYEDLCGIALTEPCCASERTDGRDVYFVEVEDA